MTRLFLQTYKDKQEHSPHTELLIRQIPQTSRNSVSLHKHLAVAEFPLLSAQLLTRTMAGSFAVGFLLDSWMETRGPAVTIALPNLLRRRQVLF